MKILKKKIYLYFILISLLVFYLHSLFTKTSVFADAKFYYAYTHSVVFDHNLLLGNEYFKLRLVNAPLNNPFVPSFYPPGVSIFWLPLFNVTYGFFSLIQIFIPHISISGYESIFEYSCAITNIFLSVFSLYLISEIIKKIFPGKTAELTVVTLFLASNLFFYTAVEPINSHAASFFISSLFLYYFLKYKKTKYYYLILGTIAGIAGLIRTQDILLFILPVIEIIVKNLKQLKNLLLDIISVFLGIFLGFLPQILLWKYFYNTFWYSPYINVGFSFLKPQIFKVLFNTQNGFFTVTPLMFFALVGIFIGLIKNTPFDKPLLIKKIRLIPFKIYSLALVYFILQLYIIASWNSDQGGSYSIRMLITTLPFLSFGLAEMMQTIRLKLGDQKIKYIIGGFTLFNMYSILNYLIKF